ncbi:SusE domain-containing protein [Mucilaginibacter pedocola]|uniref:Uncharacterized protein n=1 Tax=Mucilaginibacter pedocola TaxID=1792845 RepID=A0A1S9P6D2_9SPHI|nr:SusE domain-containing protein [Mucilaginibacter pedocola]OOQ56510.1 hypothetical protein BC343_18885 [Mucilaginibacter pedocola]
MKKFLYLTLAILCCVAYGCQKDKTLTRLATVSFPSSLTASTSAVTLSKANDTTSVVTFSWPAVTYPVKASVTYTLQIDVPADTVGANAWANATNITVGNDALSKAYKGKDLNNLAIAKGLATGAAGNLVFRVRAYQDQYAYTKAVTLAVTPYVAAPTIPVLYIPGAYQGWSPGTAPVAAALKPKIYEGYVYMPAADNYYFKFTSSPDWDHINYGDGGGGAITEDGLAGGLVSPGPGYIQVAINLNTKTWSAVPTTWGIIGDATPGGWGGDTDMTYDASKQVWTLTCDMLSTGSFKFRANHQWVIDFGITKEGKLAYADNPVFGYDGSLDNLSVPSSGNYTITLDLHDPTNYTYTLKKN